MRVHPDGVSPHVVQRWHQAQRQSALPTARGIELGDAETLDALTGVSAIVMRWGDTAGEHRAEELIAEMVGNDRVHLIRRLPELQRWLRADGRSVEQIAADWKAEQQRFAAEEAARLERIRKLRGE